jgi:hypothetical protein
METIRVTVLGGLPVLAKMAKCHNYHHEPGPPEGPPTMEDVVSDFLSVKTQKPLGNWIWKRINEAGDEDRVMKQINDHYFQHKDD